MVWFFVLVGVCACTSAFFEIIGRIERPKN